MDKLNNKVNAIEEKNKIFEDIINKQDERFTKLIDQIREDNKIMLENQNNQFEKIICKIIDNQNKQFDKNNKQMEEFNSKLEILDEKVNNIRKVNSDFKKK